MNNSTFLFIMGTGLGTWSWFDSNPVMTVILIIVACMCAVGGIICDSVEKLSK